MRAGAASTKATCPPCSPRREVERYKNLHLWMLLPMAIMQIGILRDYWGDLTEDAWSVPVHAIKGS